MMHDVRTRVCMRLASLLLLLAAPATAQTVTDGDTINLNGTVYRLWSIDAPESKQSCADGWPAGFESRRMLEDLLRGKTVACEPRGNDRYGRTIGLCRANGIDVQAAMVHAGMAWAFTRYSSDYVMQERFAVEARLGVHGHPCDKAWDWRAQRRW